MKTEAIKAVPMTTAQISEMRRLERQKESEGLHANLEKAWDGFGDSNGRDVTIDQIQNVLAKSLAVYDFDSKSPIIGLRPPETVVNQLRDAQNLYSQEGVKAAAEFFNNHASIYGSPYYQEGSSPQEVKNEYKRRAKACRTVPNVFYPIVQKILAKQMRVNHTNSPSRT